MMKYIYLMNLSEVSIFKQAAFLHFHKDTFMCWLGHCLVSELQAVAGGERPATLSTVAGDTRDN